MFKLRFRYHARDVKIFNPDQKVSKEGAKKDEDEEEEAAALEKLGEKFTSNLSLSRTGDLFANGGAGAS